MPARRREFFAFCAFDLKSASSQDYSNAYAALAAIGMKRIQSTETGGAVVIPTTSVAGTFLARSADALTAELRETIEREFQARGLTSDLFVFAGENWSWTTSAT